MKTLLLILQIFPLLITVIQSVEELIPSEGKGKEKLALIRETMTTAYSGVAEIWPVVEKIISTIVATCNTVGAFKK